MSNSDWFSKNLILVMGKGGVGKTTVAEAAASLLAAQGKRTLLIHVLQLRDEEQELQSVSRNLWRVTLRPADCFREYIMLKLRLKPLYTAFLGNKVTQYLERAAPGVREMVMLGKIWFERKNYDHVVVDMPSTGYALTMIHTPFNFADLFPGGPIYTDSKDMIETFSDPAQTAHVAVSLPEEMPAQESLEMAANLKQLMPKNPAWLVVNRRVRVDGEARKLHGAKWNVLEAAERRSPLWQALDYRVRREDKQTLLLEELRRSWTEYARPCLELDELAEREEGRRAGLIAGQLEARHVV